MYTDQRRKKWPRLVLIALVIVLAAGIYRQSSRVSAQHMAEASAAALKAAVQRSAHQCYAVEGVYPPNLAYLEEHYGLQVNHEDFYISYDAFASNLPPDIRVTPRES